MELMVTQTLGTDKNNDLYLDINGNFAVLQNLDAVIAACETASKAQLGEMVLAIDNGIPNFQTVWVGSPNYALFQSYLRNTLLAVSGVTEVKSIELAVQDNILRYTATIDSEFGLAVLNG